MDTFRLPLLQRLLQDAGIEYWGLTGSCCMQTCHGSGVQVMMRPLGPGMMQQIQQPCARCNQTGYSTPAHDTCTDCSGKVGAFDFAALHPAALAADVPHSLPRGALMKHLASIYYRVKLSERPSVADSAHLRPRL